MSGKSIIRSQFNNVSGSNGPSSAATATPGEASTNNIIK
jgi:hypothetical protein